MDRREFLAAAALATAAGAVPVFAAGVPQTVAVRIRAREVTGPLPHIWEECVGSDRAAITLRESWQQDIERARDEIGVKRVRFHGIFADELGTYTKTIQDRSGTPNFRNVAEVYDGLVSRGLAPLVEMSFMPGELASGPQAFGFYKANVTPPKSYEAYGDFIRQFGTFLVDRYGLSAVSKWPFEVWNEPNLSPFFTGKQADYFQMYKAAAVALKSISPLLQVGGPATSSIAWVPEFLSFCASENAPVDFVSTHAYPGDNQAALFGKDGARYPTSGVITAAVRLARQRIGASAFPKLPLYLDEWSSDSPAPHRACHGRRAERCADDVALGAERHVRGARSIALSAGRWRDGVRADAAGHPATELQHISPDACAGRSAADGGWSGARLPPPRRELRRDGVEPRRGHAGGRHSRRQSAA